MLCGPSWTTALLLSPYQQERLEVLQNTAMRTMLGAPWWSSACVMQSETGRVSLTTTRQEHIVACRVSRVLQRDAQGVAQYRLRLAVTQDADVLYPNPWLLRSALATNPLPRLAGQQARAAARSPHPAPMHLSRAAPLEAPSG